jgi:hypothetical protein
MRDKTRDLLVGEAMAGRQRRRWHVRLTRRASSAA